MGQIIKKYDTKKPILETFAEAASVNLDKLNDREFNLILEEYDLTEDDEDKIMQQMMESTIYKFTRVSDGWLVDKK